MALGLLIPIWALWGEGKGGVIETAKLTLGMEYDPTKSRCWLVEDANAVTSFLKSRFTRHS